MSKFNFTKILISIVFVLALVCTMSIMTFAEGTDDATEENQLVYDTEYGSFIVSDKYASVTDNPWVSFDMDTGACLRGSNIFAQDGSGILAHSGYSCTNLLVVLRDDYEISSASHPKQWYNAPWHAGRNVVIDLQGHTLTMAHSMGNGLFFCEAKTNGLLNYTFQNGNIIYKTKSTFMATYPSVAYNGFKVQFTMKNINFSVDDSVASSSFVMFATTDSRAGHNVDIKFTFEDSVLDFSNTASTVKLFEMGSAKSNIDYTLTFKGGKIVGDPNRLNTYLGSLVNQIQFRKGRKDDYPVVVLPSDAAVPTRLFEDENGNWLGFTAENSAVGEDGNITYTPVQNTNPLLTPYGVLPDDNALLAVFDINTRTVVYTGNIFTSGDANSALGYVARKSGTFAIYVRQDIPTSAFTGTVWDISVAGNNILIDLNGHTLTLGANTLFRAQVKSSSMLQYIRVFNGTINNNGRKIVDVGAVLSSDGTPRKNANINFVFTNVNFVVNNASIVTDAVERDYVNTFNVIFNDCDFNIAKDYTNILFNTGNFSNTVTNIVMNGGSINYAGSSIGTIFASTKANVSFNFGLGTNGLPIITTAETQTQEHIFTFKTIDGLRSYHFANKGATDGVSTWQFAYEKTEYGNIPVEYFDVATYPFAIFNITANAFATATSHLKGIESNNCALYYIVQNIKTNDEYVILMRRNYTSTSTSNTDLGTIGKQVITETEKTRITIDLGSHTLTLASSKNTTALFYVLSYQSANGNVTFVAKNGTISTGNEIVYNIGQTWNPKFYFVYFENVHFTNIKNSIVKEIKTTSGHNTSTTMYFTNCTFDFGSANTSTMFNLGTVTDSYRLPITIYMNGGCINYAGTGAFFTTNDVNTKHIFFGPDANGNYTTIKTADATPFSSLEYKTSTGEIFMLYESASEDGKKVFVVTPFTFVSTYLNLTHNINFVYRVYLSSAYSNPVATFSVGGDTVTVEEYTVDENGLYCFKFTGIAPHKMGDLVTASVTATCGGVQKTIVNDKVSIKNYADALRVQYAEDAEMIALLDNLLVYGAASQVYMNYNLDALVAEIGELSEVAEAPITFAGEKSDIANIAACGLLLDGAFDLRVGIKATALEGLTLDIKKGDVTTTVTLTEDMIDGEYIVVYYDGLYINELDTEVTFTLKHNGEVVGKTLTFSANAYLCRMQASQNTALANLTKALYAYGASAKAYNA